MIDHCRMIDHFRLNIEHLRKHPNCIFIAGRFQQLVKMAIITTNYEI
jgi:hypothetical protein